MAMIARKTVVGIVRFVGLFVAYVVALSAIGVVRAGRVVYRRTTGEAFDTTSGSDLADDPTDAPLSVPHSTADGDGIEEPAKRP